MTQTVDCWVRDPVALIEELIGNPEFKDVMDYAPYREEVEGYLEELRNAKEMGDVERVIEEMGSAEWWERVQVSIMIAIEVQQNTHGSAGCFVRASTTCHSRACCACLGQDSAVYVQRR